MEKCGFFDANLVGDSYDRVYVAKQFADYFASFIGNGVYAQHGDGLIVSESTPQDMTVVVKSGQGWLNGYWYENDDNFTLNIEMADGTLNRIDLVVLRLDYVQREIYLTVKKGNAAVTPVKPTPERSADKYELQLCEIAINAGATKVTNVMITDTRLDNTVCGWVTGVVDQINTEEMYNQFNSFFNSFKIEKARLFDEWFDTVRDVLEGDVATNLTNRINTLDENMTTANEKISTVETNITALQTSVNTNTTKLTNIYNKVPYYFFNKIAMFTISISSWVSTTDYGSAIKYYNNLGTVGLTLKDDDNCIVFYDRESVNSGCLSSYAEISSTGVKLFATKQPTTTVTVHIYIIRSGRLTDS